MKKRNHEGKNNPMYGKCHSEETIRKMKESKRGNKYCLGRKLSNATKIKISVAKSGENNPNWVGGVWSYWHKWGREVWEKHYGYEIPRGFLIHHRDECVANNDITNLVLLTYGLHHKVHKFKRER